MKYKIDKNIPLPPPGKRGPKQSRYPFKEMEVGDSFIFDDYDRVRMSSGSTAARIYGSNQDPVKKFATRKMGNKIRIWRIK